LFITVEWARRGQAPCKAHGSESQEWARGFPIPAGKLTFDREEDRHLQPSSEFVSRHHCVLLLDEYTLRIRDLGSTNGTFVNSRRIGTGETILSHKDIVSVGEMLCQINLTSGTTDVPSGPNTPNSVPQYG
jgi:pSer/pThr/pTyr-binding forkhead associated (FHA) protein